MPESGLVPVAPEERIEYLDVLRGFTLFGILVANWRGFGWPAEFYTAPAAVLKSPVDLHTQTFIDLFFGNKFISILSVLFGVGFAIQLDRAAERGARFVPVMRRRMAALLAMGLAHGWLLWWGDILATYAVAGVLLLLIHRLRRGAMIGLAALGLSIPLLFTIWRIATSGAVQAAARPRPPAEEIVKRAADAYLNGPWTALQRQLMHDWQVNNADGLFTALYALAWFLVGVMVWRSGFLKRLSEEKRLLKRACLWGLVLGAGGGAAALALRQIYQPRPSTMPMLLLALVAVRIVAAALLSAGYAAGVALIAVSGRWGALRRGLAAVGRLSLSNYLFQSVVGTAIYYGYGLGMYAKTGAVAGLGLSVVVFTAQMPLSMWWLRRFRYGPAEWLWRSVTYWRVEPFRRTAGRVGVKERPLGPGQ